MTEAQAIILLIDDDEAKRYLMSTWLRRAGHTVIEAGTGREDWSWSATRSSSCSTSTCPT